MSGRKALLFDLDGTLLPMDRDEFVRAYMPGISASAAMLGDPRVIAQCILQASYAMVRSTDPERTLEQVFWDVFEATSGISRAASEPLFNEFYLGTAFDGICRLKPADPIVPRIVEAARNTSLRLILATSPLFPRVATFKRVGCAGLKPDDFEMITTFEDFHAAKPNREYYDELLSKAGLNGSDCVMIGNDAREDLPAPNALGMETFLVMNHAIIPEGYKYRCDHQGRYEELLGYIQSCF